MQAMLRVPEPADGGDGKESAAVWVLVLPPMLTLAQEQTDRGETTAALSLIQALHSIQALARYRLAQSEPIGSARPPTASYEVDWKAVLEGLSKRDPALAEPLRRLANPWER